MKKLEITEMQYIEGGVNWGCLVTEAGFVVGVIGMAASPATCGGSLVLSFLGYGLGVAGVALSCG